MAQALINDPELILLDEPTSGLDLIGTREMKDLILKLMAQVTVVMSSHLLGRRCRMLADRIRHPHQGELQANPVMLMSLIVTVRDVTQFRASGLTEAAKQENRGDRAATTAN